jgi:hypothetical protein
MRKIVDYKLIYGGSRYAFTELVRCDIGAGWQPLGGLCYDTDSRIYLQAMVKYEEEKK